MQIWLHTMMGKKQSKKTALYRRQNSCSGFTIAEMIVVIGLFSILSLVIANSIHSLYLYNAYTFAQAYQVQNARKGVQVMVRDLREMTFADDGTFPLARMEDNLVGFYSDIDRDSSVEYIEYELVSSTTLNKRVYNASGSPLTYDLSTPAESYVLSEYVQNILQGTSTFAYFDASGNSLTDAADIIDVRYIQVQVIVNIDPIRDPGQYMLRSSAALRNLY